MAEDILVKVEKVTEEAKAKEEENKDKKEFVPAKLCAMEVLRYLNKIKIVTLGAIAFGFLAILVYMFSKWVGIGIIGIGAVVFGLLFVMNENETKRLKIKYKV
jgi:hypothetical protein